MAQEDVVTTPAGVPEEAGVWPPQPMIAPPDAARPLFKSPVGLARAVVVLMAVGAACDVFGLLLGSPSSSQSATSDLLDALAGLVSLATTVLFLIWTYRVARNLRAFGARGLRFGPGWAVGYFFIPVVGLYRPYQVFREFWQASDPAPASRVGQDWQFVRPPGLLLGWWLLTLAASAASLLNASQPEADGTMLVHLLNLPAAILSILVVRRITARQQQTAAVTNAG